MLGGLFKDLEFYGIRPPMHVAKAIEEKGLLSHQVAWTLYQASFAAGFTTTVPDAEHRNWLSEQYPDTFDRYFGPQWERAEKMQAEGGRFFVQGLPQLCQVCQIPMLFTELGDAETLCQRQSDYKGERYDFCSDGCQWIFDREPEKYVQAWLPVHQIFQGVCGGLTIPEVLAWYGMQPDDGGEYEGSSDQVNWANWHAPAKVGD
jgi:phenol hydroxylase P3 protein